jgi:hypothetical protein
VYFGTALPDPGWAETLVDTDVVLEPYHPLVQQGAFRDAFPNSRRYIYVNPTTVDPWILERASSPPPLIGHDERWGLPRLDLDNPAGFDWAVASAVGVLGDHGETVDGLFVDDLDRLIPDRVEIAMEYIVQVTTQLRWEPGWFVNRAFALWPLIEGLDAVLLEDITPELVAYEPAGRIRWMRDVVLENARKARRRGVRIHSLGYADQEGIRTGMARDESLEKELNELVDSVTTGADRQLSDWRVSG